MLPGQTEHPLLPLILYMRFKEQWIRQQALQPMRLCLQLKMQKKFTKVQWVYLTWE